MNRGIVVVEATQGTKDILRVAGEFAEGVGAELVLVHVTTEEEFSERSDALAGLTDLNVEYDVSRARDGAKQFANDIGHAVLNDRDVTFEAVGRLGEVSEEILTVAKEYECDHLFVSGRQRSPTGKAIFGDVAQNLILNFDGPVTVSTA